MNRSSLRNFGQFALTALAVSLGVASLSAQTPSSTAPVGINPPRFDIFTGYSYFGAHGQVKPAGINYSSIDLGAIGSGAYYFNKYFGGEIIYVNHPNGNNDGFSSISAGPIFRAPMQNFTLFAHGLAGGGRLGGPNSEGPIVYHEPYTWGPALTVGGGMDYDLPFWNNRFSLRLFQADYRYVHANYGPAVTPPTSGVLGGRANLSGVDLSTGIVTHFGHIIPPPPVTYSCSVSPSTAFPGDPLTVTGTPLNLNPKKQATYNWSSDGSTTGTGTTANIDTKNLNPGTYTVKGHVQEGNKPGEMADCSAQFTIQQFGLPSVTCSANPATINQGDSVTITANGVSPQNRPLTYSYSAQSGSVGGNGSTATYSSTGAQPGTVAVTCSVADDQGHTASSTASLAIVVPPTPAPEPQQLEVRQIEQRLALHSVFFPTAQPTAMHPDFGLVASQQATLAKLAADFKRYLEFNPDARLVLTGHTDVRGTAAFNQALSERRVALTKGYLVQQGIPETHIEMRAVGKEQQLTAEQVKEMLEQNQQLTAEQRQDALRESSVIVLAQNRRVDVILSTTGQQSVRQFPFNAADALTLLNQKSSPPIRKTTRTKKK
jgi:outer membrane protein OmpA-like peptidoglycan-associated protein